MPTNGLDTAKLSLVIHDLRNVLNAMAMTQYCIESGLPDGNAMLRSDVAMIGEGIGQFRQMLDVLSAYGHNVLDGEKPLSQRKFEPAALVRDIVEEVRSRAPGKRLTMDLGSGLPAEVEAADEATYLALKYGLQNAIAALANGSEVLIQAGGGPEVWHTRFVTLEAPAETIQAGTVDPADVQRLVGNARERRGLDLAIVATLCERAGGRCRIEVEPGKSSSLLLEWPVRPPS
jgi:signal transduction histidine kinase